jgi:hypothetical protein
VQSDAHAGSLRRRHSGTGSGTPIELQRRVPCDAATFELDLQYSSTLYGLAPIGYSSPIGWAGRVTSSSGAIVELFGYQIAFDGEEVP